MRRSASFHFGHYAKSLDTVWCLIWHSYHKYEMKNHREQKSSNHLITHKILCEPWDCLQHHSIHLLGLHLPDLQGNKKYWQATFSRYICLPFRLTSVSCRWISPPRNSSLGSSFLLWTIWKLSTINEWKTDKDIRLSPCSIRSSGPRRRGSTCQEHQRSRSLLHRLLKSSRPHLGWIMIW